MTISVIRSLKILLLTILFPVAPAMAENEPVVFPAMAVSLGRVGRVTARLTYDKKKAAEGGRILAAPELSKADLEAIRMSEAVATTSGGLLSFASLAAREHAIPAVILAGASWKDGVLVLERPVYGPSKKVESFQYQAVEKTVPVELHEDDVVTVDAQASSFEIYPPADQEGRLSLAQAMRAYEGLRDPQSLIQWYEGASNKSQAGPWLVSELAERVYQGAAGAEDLSKILQAVKVPASDALNSVWTRSLRAFMASMKETEKALQTAGSAEAAAHLRDEAAARWERLRGLRPALYFSGPDRNAAAAHRRVSELAAKRLKSLASSKAGLAEAAASAGALLPRRVELPADAYRRFIVDNGLGPMLDDLIQNSSLGLRRKSERIRAAIRKGRLGAELSRDLRAKLPAGWTGFLVAGSAGSVSSSADGLEDAIKEVWAALWSPASLGSRERRGRSLSAQETVVVLQESVKGGVSGAMMTRDLASGSRARMTVSVVPGDFNALLSPDQYVVGPSGREILPAVVADRERGRVLDAESLERLARLASALESHFGRGLELRFAFAGQKVYLLEARPIAEENALLIPRVQLKVEKLAPNVEPVRALGQ